MKGLLFALLILMSTSAFAQDKDPDLKTTLYFMQNTLSRYGYIHDKSKDQELTRRTLESRVVFMSNGK